MTRAFGKFWIFLTAFTVIFGFVRQADPPSPVSRPENVQLYLKKYKYLSVELSQQTGIPLPIILAVAGLESNWGSSELAQNANNHFGLKIKEDWSGQEYCFTTQEFANGYAYEAYECFRKYPLIRQSYQDFGRFLLSREHYQGLFGYPSWNYYRWAAGLQDSGYATDPEYAQKLIRLIEVYQLDEL
ncbi:MAG: glucosaminidase domain-containing protein [Phaeodactylibacter sp.]|nr:glucosaminidase domain-containing protein [Phaeodactylibacter sp.]MCB9272777.1 glucosaminidase domain-containing protein [Lewinellaceae bacterium]